MAINGELYAAHFKQQRATGNTITVCNADGCSEQALGPNNTVIASDINAEQPGVVFSPRSIGRVVTKLEEGGFAPGETTILGDPTSESGAMACFRDSNGGNLNIWNLPGIDGYTGVHDFSRDDILELSRHALASV